MIPNLSGAIILSLFIGAPALELPPLFIGSNLDNIQLTNLVDDVQTVLNRFENENYIIFIEKKSESDHRFHLLFKEKVNLHDMVRGILHAHIGRQMAQEVCMKVIVLLRCSNLFNCTTFCRVCRVKLVVI